jgi:excisionase family DNA binding protein
VGSKQPERDVGPPLFLTYKEAAKKIGVSLSKLYQLLRDGEITSVPLGPQVRRVSLSECEAYAARKVAEAEEKRAARAPDGDAKAGAA